MTTFYVLDDDTHVTIQVSYSQKTRMTKVIIDNDLKNQQIVKGKTMPDALPITFWYEKRKWKVTVGQDE